MENFVELSIARYTYWGLTEEEATIYAANELMRTISPTAFEMYEQLNPLWPDYAPWSHKFETTKLLDIWTLRVNKQSSPEKNRIPIKEALIYYNGNSMIFGVEYDWREDIGTEVQLPYYTREDGLFVYINGLTNGHDNPSPWNDTIDNYFKLETRNSFDHPGEIEYYYEGRDYNIVPYNPHATGADDRQDPTLSANGLYNTVYYLEFKNFNDPEFIPDSTEFYYPNMFKNTGDTTTITLAARPYMAVGDIPLFNSYNSVVYNQVIHWINPEAPILDGLTNTTITAGTAFDPL